MIMNIKMRLLLDSFFVAIFLLSFYGRNVYAEDVIETRIDNVTVIKSSAIADNTYENGLKWIIDLTVPWNETHVSMKFDDLISGTSTIKAEKNIRYYSKQFDDTTSGESAITVEKVGVYDNYTTIDPALDLDKKKAGVQIKIEIEAFVPKDTPLGEYSLKYGLQSLDKTPPIIIIGDYIKTPTSKDVVVTATVLDGVLKETSHIFTENGTFDFVATDEAGNVATTSVIVDYIYKTPPPLILKGDNPLTVERYGAYRDPGYRVIADIAAGYSWWSTISSFRTDRVGEFEIKYFSRDPAGNMSTATRKVFVVDTTPPVINVLPYNTNPTNQDVLVKISVDGGYAIGEEYLFTKNGKYTFWAADDVGNKASTTVVINNIDKEKPKIELIGNNPLIFEVDDLLVPSIDARLVDNDSTSNNIEINFNGLDWGNVGDYQVKYNGKDNAGNIADEVIRNIKVIDTRPPVIKIRNYDKDTLTNSSVMVCADAVQDVLNEICHTFTQNGSFDFVAKDKVGNTTTSTVSVNNIDKILPVIKLIGDSTFVTERYEEFKDPFVTISDNNSIDISRVSKKTNLDVNIVGEYTIEYNAIDKAGNNAEKVIRTVRVVDTKPPVITFEPFDSNTPTNKSIEVIARINEGMFSNKTASSTEPRVTSYKFSEKIKKHTFSATDEYGNKSSVQLELNNIDQTPPRITLNGEKEITLERWVKYMDSGYSCTDNVACAPLDEFPIIDTTKVTGNNPIIVTYYAKDTAGNISSSTSRKINVVDTKPPEITFDEIPTEDVNTDITVVAHINEGVFLSEPSHTFTENGEYTFRAIDDVGHLSEIVFSVQNIDREKPVMTLKGLPVITLNAGDTYSDEGVNVSDNSDTTLLTVEDDSNLVDTSVAGEYVIHYNVKDKAGNIANTITRKVIVI